MQHDDLPRCVQRYDYVRIRTPALCNYDYTITPWILQQDNYTITPWTVQQDDYTITPWTV